MNVQLHKTFTSQIVEIPVNHFRLEGELVIPTDATGLVVFAHGSGSSRHSPRNKLVADVLHENSIATLLVDLLSEDEDSDYERRFDISLLAERLRAITSWVMRDERTQSLAIGYFGASTGAAAALFAANSLGNAIKAVVSRGGRVDMAREVARTLRAPTLLVVGQEDDMVRDLNEDMLRQMAGPKELVLVPNATHLFEEPGALDQVAALAVEWFKEYLGG